MLEYVRITDMYVYTQVRMYIGHVTGDVHNKAILKLRTQCHFLQYISPTYVSRPHLRTYLSHTHHSSAHLIRSTALHQRCETASIQQPMHTDVYMLITHIRTLDNYVHVSDEINIVFSLLERDVIYHLQLSF